MSWSDLMSRYISTTDYCITVSTLHYQAVNLRGFRASLNPTYFSFLINIFIREKKIHNMIKTGIKVVS